MARITKIKKIRMTVQAKGSPNGICVLLYPEGASYDVGPSGPMSLDLAENFVRGGQAVEIKEETKNEPAAPDNKDAAKQKDEDKKDKKDRKKDRK